MTRMLARTLALAAALVASTAGAQAAPPSTDVWLVPVNLTAAKPYIGTPVNVTNRPGYDNQPSFTPDGRAILFTSVRDSQADIWRYDVRSRATRRVTATPESEYSATAMPGGRRFSAVRVERDSTQRLWSFALDGSDPRLVLGGIRPVGYHAWLDDRTVALFVLGRPAMLQVADVRSGRADTLAHDIGRSLLKLPARRAFSFLQHADSAWWLTVVDIDQRTPGDWEMQRVAKMPEGADYVAWLSDGRAITGAGSKLLVLDRGASEWRELADFASAKLDRISRLALSRDGRWLAFVAEPRP